MSIVELPGDGIEHSGETVLGDTAAEERIGGQGAKCVIANLGIGWRCPLPNKIEIGISAKRRSVEEDEPDVYTELGLCRG